MDPQISTKWHKYSNELRKFYIDNMYDLTHYSGNDVDINEQVPGSAICNECITEKKAFCDDCPKKSVGLLSRYYNKPIAALASELIKNFLTCVVNKDEDNPCLRLVDVKHRDPYDWGYTPEKVYLLQGKGNDIWTIKLFYSDEELYSEITYTDKKDWINLLMDFSLKLARNLFPRQHYKMTKFIQDDI